MLVKQLREGSPQPPGLRVKTETFEFSAIRLSELSRLRNPHSGLWRRTYAPRLELAQNRSEQPFLINRLCSRGLHPTGGIKSYSQRLPVKLSFEIHPFNHHQNAHNAAPRLIAAAHTTSARSTQRKQTAFENRRLVYTLLSNPCPAPTDRAALSQSTRSSGSL